MLLALFGFQDPHPQVVHFPIALAIVAPLFLLLAVLIAKHTRALAFSGWVLLALAAIGAWVAVNSGEAAEHAAKASGAAKELLHQHEEMAELAAMVLSILAGLLAVILALPWIVARWNRTGWIRVAVAVVLALVIAADVLVGVTAHKGGRLVHEFGVSATSVRPAAPALPVRD